METMMETHKKIRVHISALSDGELAPADLELALAALQGADGRQAWNIYHRIGDVLRAQAIPDLSDAFLDKLNTRLAAEAAPGKRSPRPAGEGKKPLPGLGKPGHARPATATATGTAAVGAVEVTLSTDAKAVVKPKPAIVSVS